ncbi:Fc receptor-like protein 4 [Lates calcarifer]|uniref:Fc receptor-like protein 4 n=1 Tax=Lates calcarifer TaxID=8187 RepID=A0AAJ8DMZ0_LATCA|nr:Fc receptor-like protein 4 [Lates calcarifer]
MKTPSLLLGVSVLLSGLTVSAVFLDIHPNRPQFFSGETVTLSCGGLQDSAGWTLKRTDVYLRTKPCGGGFGRMDGSSCVVSDLSSLDSGSYWCEDGDGQRSDELRVFVSDHVILEIPALPVTTGSQVTLRCRSRSEDYKLRGIIRARIVGDRTSISTLSSEFTIHHVQQSDEGSYTCLTVSDSKMKKSGWSRLTVTAPPPETCSPSTPPDTTTSSFSSSSPSPPSPPPPSPPPPPLLSPPSVSVLSLLIFCLLVFIVLMVSICCSRRRGNKPAVSMTTTHLVGEDDDIAADVTTEHDPETRKLVSMLAC